MEHYPRVGERRVTIHVVMTETEITLTRQAIYICIIVCK
jgi:hypothetical protein